ncbi:hypothetical protein AB0B31_00205 [Catellatospora citrea]|uniref:hypothetical protein n=1 Tax=Catellatospora citrea TaxID=53366 RepID=UPI0033E9EBC9
MTPSTPPGRHAGFDWLRRRFGRWSILIAALAIAVAMHLFVLAERWLLGEQPPQPFSWRAFAGTWLLMAVISVPLEWWLQRRPNAGPPRWQPGLPRALRIAGAAADLVWTASTFAASMLALNSEMPLLWADAVAALVYVPMAVLQDISERHEPVQAAAAEPPG